MKSYRMRYIDDDDLVTVTAPGEARPDIHEDDLDRDFVTVETAVREAIALEEAQGKTSAQGGKS